jgi:hypothetical protein
VAGSRQWRGWAAELQESPGAGQRRLTEAARNRSEQHRGAEEFTQSLKRNFQPAPFPNPPKADGSI